MNAEQLQAYIETHIPVVVRNGLTITDCSEHLVTVQGNYAQHVNHVQTVFGGSIGMALTVAAWAHVRSLMDAHAHEVAIVVRRQSVEFDHPVTTDFRAETLAHPAGVLETFLQVFERSGKARLIVRALLLDADERACATFEGQFVVLKKANHAVFGQSVANANPSSIN